MKIHLVVNISQIVQYRKQVEEQKKKEDKTSQSRESWRVGS